MQKKRAHGEGTLRMREDGRWEITLMDGFRSDGKRNIKSFYGKTQKEVKAKAKAYQKMIDDGLVIGENYTFSEWADLWFEYHRDNLALSSQEGYQYTLRALKEYFGHRRIADIKPIDVEIFLKSMVREGRSASYITKSRGMLYQIMNKAEANDYIRKNPVRFAEKTRNLQTESTKDAFTEEEVRLLMENLPDDRIGWCIRLLLGTGMRTQELLALEPRFIEPDGSVIHIRQAVMMAKGTPVISTPKTNDSTRDVPVPEIVRYCAINLRNTDDTFILEARKKDSPCNPSYFRKKYKEYLERIPNVRFLTPHSCRHTYVSQMQALGVDLDTIRSLVGHASMSMTQHYLHVQEPVRQDAIDRFTQAFGSKPEPPAPESVVGLPERKPAKDRARSHSYIRPVKGGRSGTKR